MSDSTPNKTACRRPGLTLVELVASMAIMSVIMLALGSALLLTGKALPDSDRASTRLIRDAQIADQIMAELREARHIFERTGRTIGFTVADRNGDDSPERIRYAWSGTAGDPLTRQYNGGTQVELLDDVHEFSLACQLQAVAEEYPGPPVEGAEELLSSYEAGSDLDDAKVEDNKWWAEYFKPTFAAEAVCWSVTRVKFLAKRDDDHDYTTIIQLRLPEEDFTPSEEVIDETTLAQLSLTDSYQWIERSFTNATGLWPDEGICLTFKTDDDKSAKLRKRKDHVVLPDAGLSEGKPEWEPIDTDEALLFYAYGTVSTRGPTQTATRQYVTGIRLTLQTGDDAASRIDTAVYPLNTPEVLSAIWELDFDTDPTTLDMNGDGYTDWEVRGGGSINPANLVNGVWRCDAELDTVPDNDFTMLTTVDLNYRSTNPGDSGAYFWINADYTGGTFMPIVATVLLSADGTQQQLYVTVGGSTVVKLRDLPTDFVALRLLIDPDLDTVNIQIEDVDRGTFAYTPYAPGGDPQCATLNEWGSDGEFDYVRIRVGGTGS